MGQVQATEDFYTEITGVSVWVHKDEILDADHDIVRNTPAEWWKPLANREIPVEEATAKPGAKRATAVKKAKATKETPKASGMLRSTDVPKGG